MSEVIESVACMAQVLKSRPLRHEYPGSPLPMQWYRGHGDWEWELLPGVLRESYGNLLSSKGYDGDQIEFILIREKFINNEFRRRAGSMLPSGCSPVEAYFIAQHHRLPTRLLDWTTNALAALFFAAAGDPGRDGALFVMVPEWSVSHWSDGTQQVWRLTDWHPDGEFGLPVYSNHRSLDGVIPFLFDEGEPCGYSKPIAVLPGWRAGRMAQQAAAFTLHPPCWGADRDIPTDYVSKYRVPKESKSEIVKELRHMGIDWGTIFADLDHVALELRQVFEIKH